MKIINSVIVYSCELMSTDRDFLELCIEVSGYNAIACIYIIMAVATSNKTAVVLVQSK